MTKTKSTKSALISSVIALFLCFTMLLGTTFAWFTDSVTSSGNKIMSGTLLLDFELLDKENGEWNSIKASEEPIFSYDKWEPGYTDVKILKVENEGTLALKWKAKFVSENKLSELANVIDVYVCPSKTELTYPENRNLDDYTRVGTVAEFVNTIETTTTGRLEAGATAYLGIALKMQESAGNEYQGLELGGAFDIMLLATQDSAESDSFGSDYDANADFADEISTLDSFKQALVNGGSYKLNTDITNDGTESLEIAEGVTVELNLNGYTVANAVAGEPAIVNKGTLKISGDGAVKNGTNSARASHTISNFGTLVINGGSIGTDDTAGSAVINAGTAIINNGTFASKQENAKADGLCAYAFINNGGTMTINNATLNGQTHGLFGAYAGKIVVNGGTYTMDGNGGLGCYAVYATGDAEVVLVGGTIRTDEPRSNRVFFVYNGGNKFNGEAVATDNLTYIGTEIYLNGVLQSYEEDGVKAVADATELQTALTNGGNVVLTSDMDVETNLSVGADTVIYGQDNALTFKNNTKITVAKDVSLEIIGATLDAGGQFSFDETGSIVYDAAARRTTPILNASAGSTLTLGAGTVVENVVAQGSAVVSASGTADNRATVTLAGASVQNCAGESGTIINASSNTDVYIEEGTVVSNNASYNNNNHGIMKVYNGSVVTMNGGEINGNYYSGNGMIGLWGGSKVIMNGGEIKDNSWFSDNQVHNGWYPVIYVHSNSQFVMNGGEITGNIVKYGVINSLNSGVEGALTINGGTITDNIATNNENKEAFAVVISKAKNSLVVSEEANVSGTVWVYYDENGNYLGEYHELDEYFAE